VPPHTLSRIGKNTPSTTITIDELETIALIEEALLRQLAKSKVQVSAGDFLNFTVHLSDSQAYHANGAQGDAGAPTVGSGIYARIGGLVERAGASDNLTLSINHFEGLMRDESLGIINVGPSIDLGNLP
jgi:hypothetical protein